MVKTFLYSSLILFAPFIFSQNEYDTVKAQEYDMGRMWTFENPPIDYFEEKYDFVPRDNWLEHVRLSALKFGGGCSASFISEDGLIMTNHHCVRGSIPSIEKENEDFLKTGFYAKEYSEERRIPGLFVDQLVFIQDVTEEVKEAMSNGTSDEEKIKLKNEKIKEIEERELTKNDLKFKVQPLYYGGKFSLYGYKRYNDIRLVFVPDLRTAKFGGDYDNFTYPRYGLDCAFLRAYDDKGDIIKTENYLSWSDSGAQEGEAVFVIGNPGSTNRLNTIAQIEFARDHQYPFLVKILRKIYSVYEEEVMNGNTENYELVAKLYSIGNSLKVYEGTYAALNNEYILARKKDFEKQFRSAILRDEDLKKKYGHIWNEIALGKKEAASFSKELSVFGLSPSISPQYFSITAALIRLAQQFSLPEDQRSEDYKPGKVELTISKIYPADFNNLIQKKVLAAYLDAVSDLLKNDSTIYSFTGGKNGSDAAGYIVDHSIIPDKEKTINFAKNSPAEFLNADDPLIRFIIKVQNRIRILRERNSDLQNKEILNNQLLGEALFEVYGNSIPPDATGTLRIADGVVSSYNYNGTVAPVKTTFYGVLDRHYSFNKRFPYNLPDFWKSLPEEFDLGTPLDFISTNDIIGGNSGSPVVNKKGEVVGLAFDGNYESLSNRYIHTEEAERTISVHSLGIIEAIRDLYKADKLYEEITQGKAD